MTPFFRRIRQKLSNENQFLKYSKYAIGEIILVVLGILIALQINNWNNVQNDKQAEIKYLKQLLSSLEDNYQIIGDKIATNQRLYEQGVQLFKDLKQNKELNDSIKRRFLIPQFDQAVLLNTAAFENFKNDGMSLISNEELKFEIINIYEQELKYMQITFADQFENYITQVIHPFYSRNFEITTKNEQWLATPNDYEGLLRKREFTNILSSINSMREYAIQFHGESQKDIKDLINKIEAEIDKLEN